jgi:hypothetical protein
MPLRGHQRTRKVGKAIENLRANQQRRIARESAQHTRWRNRQQRRLPDR